MALADPSAQYGSPDGGKGKGKEEQRPYLRVRITGLERNRKDLLIRFDASVSPFAHGCLKQASDRTDLTVSDEPDQFPH
jgi:hypothetical protein